MSCIYKEPIHPIAEPTECPNCGNPTLVHRNDSEYQCIWCGFHHDIFEASRSGFPWFSLLLSILVLVGLLTIEQTRNTTNLQNLPNSQPFEQEMPVDNQAPLQFPQ